MATVDMAREYLYIYIYILSMYIYTSKSNGRGLRVLDMDNLKSDSEDKVRASNGRLTDNFSAKGS